MSRTARARLGRALGLVCLVLLAATAGAVGAFVHRTTLDVSGLTVPVGLAAALSGLVGLLLLARMLAAGRGGVLVVAGAYGVPVLVLSQFRPEGDLVVAEDVWGLALLGGAALVVTVAVAVPIAAYHGTPRGASDGAGPSPSLVAEMP
jgi:hypothetical protein